MPKPKQTPATPSQAWTAPRLVRLGAIADVAGSGPPGAQGTGATRS